MSVKLPVTKFATAFFIAHFVAGGSSAIAQLPPISNENNFNYIRYFGPNAAGIETGLFLQLGGYFEPVVGTSVTATQGNTTLQLSSNPGLPKQFDSRLPLASIPFVPDTPWTLNATNANFAPITVQTNVLLSSVYNNRSNLAGNVPISVQVSNLSVSPSVRWILNTTTVADFPETTWFPSVESFDANTGAPTTDGSGTYFWGKLGDCLGCPYLVEYPFLGGNVLTPGGQYIIDVLSGYRSSSLQATAESFFWFSPSKVVLDPDVPIWLPSTSASGSFQFFIPVEGLRALYLDPAAAIGYDFQIGTGDPLFRSVKFPDLGDFSYLLYFWDGAEYLFDQVVSANTEVVFAGGGVDRFRVLGLDSLVIDPRDSTAFPVQVTFADDGMFTGTMTPLVANVPEPATLALLGLGLAGLGFSRRN